MKYTRHFEEMTISKAICRSACKRPPFFLRTKSESLHFTVQVLVACIAEKVIYAAEWLNWRCRSYPKARTLNGGCRNSRHLSYTLWKGRLASS
jgi:hypothetical protein